MPPKHFGRRAPRLSLRPRASSPRAHPFIEEKGALKRPPTKRKRLDIVERDCLSGAPIPRAGPGGGVSSLPTTSRPNPPPSELTSVPFTASLATRTARLPTPPPLPTPIEGL